MLGFLPGPLLGGSLVRLLAPDYGLPAAYRAAFLAAGSAEVLCAVLSIPFLRRLARPPAAPLTGKPCPAAGSPLT